jgi:hypothetical protein
MIRYPPALQLHPGLLMSAIGQRQRAVSALAVLLLHALLVFSLLHFLVKPQSAGLPVAERVLEFIISPPKVVAPMPVPVAPRRQRVPVQEAPPGGKRSGAMPSLAPPVESPDIRGFGQALLGCAPENLSNLTAEQRARCHSGFSRPDDAAVIEPRSHVKDPARRAAEMAARSAATRVPCTSIINAPVGGGTAAVPMIDPACIAEGTAKGFAPLNGLSK